MRPHADLLSPRPAWLNFTPRPGREGVHDRAAPRQGSLERLREQANGFSIEGDLWEGGSDLLTPAEAAAALTAVLARLSGPITTGSQYSRAQPRIYISYRREDSKDVVGRLQDILTSHFGYDSVFTDMASIPLGLDFRQLVAGVAEQRAAFDDRMNHGPTERERRRQ